MIMTEMVHDARVIRMGGTHIPKHVRPWMGDSIGRWEGDTLVVETTNFHPLQMFQGAFGEPQSNRAADPNRSGRDRYRFTIEDPTVFTAPWTGELVFNRTDEMIYEYACHEGNYALTNILGGERARERASDRPEET